MFNKVTLWSVLLLLLCGNAFASSFEDNFRLANDAYSQKDYNKALAIYKMLESESDVSGELYYNMGNAFLKKNNKGLAMLYYLRAYQLMPRDLELRENMAFLKSLLVDKVENGQTYLAGKAAWIRGIVSLSELITGIIFFYILFLVLVLLILFVPAYSRLFSCFAAITLCCLCLSLSAYTVLYYTISNNPQAVVTSPSARIFYSPAVSDNPAFIVHEGLIITVVKEQNGFMQVNIETSDMSGWMASDDLQLV